MRAVMRGGHRRRGAWRRSVPGSPAAASRAPGDAVLGGAGGGDWQPSSRGEGTHSAGGREQALGTRQAP
jgi:hypothetical protein